MPGTITIAGKQYPKSTVIVAGAATAGIVGYAWFKKGMGGSESEIVAPELPEPVPEPGDEPGFDVSGGGPPPSTNADWSSKAVTQLSNFGIDATALYSAIGKFLQRKPLNKVEADLVRQAISAAGYPPENGPWVIIEETSPGPVTPPQSARPGMPAVVNAVGWKVVWRASWSAVAGATSYEIRAIRGYPAGTGLPWRNVGKVLSANGILRVKAPTTYSFEVRARNSVGAGPAKRSGPVRINP